MRKASILVAALAAVAAFALPAFAATSSVKVGDNYFIKSSGAPKLTVKKGTTVKWRWVGTAPHDVTVTKGPAVEEKPPKQKPKGTVSERMRDE
jgi:plastocyanin